MQEKGSDEIVLKAMGRAINKTVMIAELIKVPLIGLTGYLFYNISVMMMLSVCVFFPISEKNCWSPSEHMCWIY